MRKFLKRMIEYLFYLFLFLLPWQTRLVLKEGVLNNGPWEWGTISLYAIDIIFIILLILFCLKSLISKNFQLSIFNFQTIKLLVICFLSFAFLSIFWAKNQELAFYWWLRILQGAMLFFLIQKIDLDFIKVSFSLVFAGLIQALLGFHQFINQKIFASKWLGIAEQDPSRVGVSVVEVGGGRLLRIYGSLPHPNILGGFLVFIIFVAFLSYFLTKKSWQKYFFLFSTSLIMIALLLTYSRAALISLILSIFLFGLLFLKKKLAYWRASFFEFFGLVLIAVLIFSGFFVSDLITRAQLKGRLEKISIQERILGFQRGKEIIRENFLFGVGPGNYTLALYQKHPNFSSWDYQPIANIYFLILAELGIVGLLLFFFILYFSLSRSVIGYRFLVVSLLVLGLFDHWLFSLSFGIILFFTAIGLLWKTKEKKS